MGQVAIIMKNEFKLCPKCNRFVNSNDVVPQKGKTKRKKTYEKIDTLKKVKKNNLSV